MRAGAGELSMSNRVEELESKVAELQATVDGLTEELVETKERLRQLERTTDGAAGGPSRRAEPRDEGDKPAEPQEGITGEESASESKSESESEDNDIIVA